MPLSHCAVRKLNTNSPSDVPPPPGDVARPIGPPIGAAAAVTAAAAARSPEQYRTRKNPAPVEVCEHEHKLLSYDCFSLVILARNAKARSWLQIARKQRHSTSKYPFTTFGGTGMGKPMVWLCTAFQENNNRRMQMTYNAEASIMNRNFNTLSLSCLIEGDAGWVFSLLLMSISVRCVDTAPYIRLPLEMVNMRE